MRFGVRTLQSIAIVLRAVIHCECLALQLLGAHLLAYLISNQVRACGSFLQTLLPSILGVFTQTHHRRRSRVRLGSCPIVLVQVTDWASPNDRLALLIFKELSHKKVVLVHILVLVAHVRT